MIGAQRSCDRIHRHGRVAADPGYRPGPVPVLVLGIDRPSLAAALAERGLTAGGNAVDAAVALVPQGKTPLACPTVVEARSAAQAGLLLDGGADDVVLRTDPDDLVAARLAALVRRLRPSLLNVGDIAIDTVERRVMRRGQPLPLLPREYSLLHFLARHAGSAIDHATLHQVLWGRAFNPGTNVLAVHVSRLRARLTGSGVVVVTDRGKGYRLVAPVAAGQEHG